MIADSASTYRCVSDIVWVKDAEQTILIEQAGKRSWMIRREESAIWDWLTLNHPSEKIVHFLSVLSGTSTEEARKALAWLQANPGRRKTPRGMPRFLFGWMERTQNRRGSNGQPSSRVGAAKPEPGKYDGI